MKKIPIIVFLICIPLLAGAQQPPAPLQRILTMFSDYLELVRDNCDFKRQFPREVLNELTKATQATCYTMLNDMESAGNLVKRFDIASQCDHQTEMTIKACEDNLKLCQNKYGELKPIMEACRSKIRTDIINYKKLKGIP